MAFVTGEQRATLKALVSEASHARALREEQVEAERNPRSCLWCGELLPVESNPKRQFCNKVHKGYWWGKYTERGRAYVQAKKRRLRKPAGVAA